MNLESVFGRLRQKYLSATIASSRAPRSLNQRLRVESLESREVPAVLPDPIIEATTIRGVPDNSSTLANDTNVVLAQDPLNSSVLISASVRRTRDSFGVLTNNTQINLMYSSNGGDTWVNRGSLTTGIDPNPTTFNNSTFSRYTNVSSPALAFDRFHNVYLTYIESDAGSTSGRIVLRKFTTNGIPAELPINIDSAHSQVNPESTVYQWMGTDPAYNTTIAIDTNALVDKLGGPTAADNQIDPLAETQTDETKVKVFIAWNTNDVSPTTNPNQNFTKAKIRMVMSSDGGTSFSPPILVNGSSANSANNSGGNQAYTSPQLAFTPGRSDQAGSGGKLITMFTAAADTNGNLSPNLQSDVATFGAPNVDPLLDTSPKSWQAGNFTPAFLVDAGPNNTPRSLDYTIPVSSGSGITDLQDLSIRLSLQHNALSELNIQLISPPDAVTGISRTLTLVRNAVANTNFGITGTLLGNSDNSFTNSYQFGVGTTFTDSAARSIKDGSAASPYTGLFRPEGGSLRTVFSGMTDAEITGDWTLRITDVTTTTPPTNGQDFPHIKYATLSFSQNFNDGLGGSENRPGIGVNNNSVTGIGHPQASNANPNGIGTGLSLAIDNTVGKYSPNQNRVYTTYVSGGNVFVNYSDDGGVRWSTAPTNLGAGFNPKVTVDPTNGTVVVSFYSAAADPSGRRSLMMLATSITGPSFTTNGSPPTKAMEFSKPYSVNPTDTTYNQITGKDIAVEKVPTNPAALGPLAFGNNIGLSAYAGRVNLLYTGNTDRINPNDNTASQIRTQSIKIASGPRVVKADFGPILGEASANDTRAGGLGTIYYNGVATNGQNTLDKFYVEFDRVIDPSTFTPADVMMVYRPAGADSTNAGTRVAIASVDPLDEVLDPVDGSVYGSKKFLISLTTPQTAAGTYSYAIGSLYSDPLNIDPDLRGYQNGLFGQGTDPNGVSDRIPSIANVFTKLPYSPGNDDYDSSFYATNNSLPLRISDQPLNGNATTVTNVMNLPTPVSGNVVGDVSVKINISHADVSQLQISLTSPSGQTIQLIKVNDATGTDFTDTNFADSGIVTIASSLDSGPYTGTYKALSAFSALTGTSIGGNWTLTITDRVTGEEGFLTNWSLQITQATFSQGVKSGNQMDQNGNSIQNEDVQDVFAVPNPTTNSASGTITPFIAQFNTDSLPIIVPGPRVISTQPVSASLSTNNLVVNGTTNGLDVAFDRTMNSSTLTSADILRLIGPTGEISLAGVTVSPITALGGTTTTGNSKYFRISFPVQKLAGQYQIQLGSDIADSNGFKMDKDTNAGVNVLLGKSTTSTTQDFKYGTSAISVNVPAKSTVTTTLNVPDGFSLTKLVANLSMSVAATGELRNLSAQLVSPDGSTSVLLFQDVNNSSFSSTAFKNVTFTDDIQSTALGNDVSPVQSGFVTDGFNNPIQQLSQFNGTLAKGNWKLVVTNKGTVAAGVQKFSLTLSKPLLGSGLGDPVADQSSLDFRIFQASGASATARGNWNPIGPDGSSSGNSTAGKISNIQVDPSDSSGNTVYAAGASGGLWRTTNFLTRDAAGPIWVPLTDLGTNQVIRDVNGNVIRYGSSINVGSIALFNDTADPSKTKIVIGTGSNSLNLRNGGQDGNRYDGVGMLYSEDAGKTWQIFDSKTNFGVPTDPTFGTSATYLPGTDVKRDHLFVGAEVNKVVFEKKLVSDTNPSIIYAAISQGSTPLVDNVAGLWRTLDGGKTWTQLFQGDATDFTVGEGSAQANTGNRPTIGYLAVRGVGIFTTNSLNQTLPTFTLMAGGNGRPEVQQGTGPNAIVIPTNAPAATPNGAKGRITIVSPSYILGNALANNYYQSWLVAAVSTPAGRFDGLYVTKDQGKNWTKVKLTSTGGFNDSSPDIETLNIGNSYFSGGFADESLSLALDPNDPNIVYVGADRIIRVDISQTNDPYKLQLYSHSDTTGGLYNTTVDSNSAPITGGGLNIKDTTRGFPSISSLTPVDAAYDAALQDPRRGRWNFTNLARNPYAPFLSSSTLGTIGITNFQNDGGDTTWVEPVVDRYFSFITNKVVNVTESGSNADFVGNIVTTIDPLTGRARILWAHDNGIGTFVSNSDGSLNRIDGFDQSGQNLFQDTDLQIYGNRNGNIQVARLYSGDVQPSLLAASIAQSLIYGAARSTGDLYESAEDLLGSGNTTFSGDNFGGITNWVQADPTGSGAVYILRNVGSLSNSVGYSVSDFFQISLNGGTPFSRTTGLFTQPGDSVGTGQWDSTVRRFSVNPIDGKAIAISSRVGRVFATTNQGLNWAIIANPTDLDSTYVPAIAYGAPAVQVAGQPAVDLNNYIYAGTAGGRIYVKTGTSIAPTWINISNGLDGSAIQKIVPNPTRGSNAAYAVTLNGVYFNSDWTVPGSTWKNISGNLFNITRQALNLGKSFETTSLYHLSSLAVDWRPTYNSASAVPTLYVAGDSGVYVSSDAGTTWSLFTNAANGATNQGGGLPVVKISDLDLSIGNTIQSTGRVDSTGAPNLLVATTLGRGIWTLALATPPGTSGPKIIPENVSPNAPINGTFSSVIVEFNSYVDGNTFTPDDVVIKGPNGNIIPAFSVTDITVPLSNGVNLHNRYQINFATQSDDGSYSFTVGPYIADGGGTLMNQNANGVNGEPITSKSLGDAFNFSVVIGNNDLADFVKDSYQKLLNRAPTTIEYNSKIVALEKARFTALGTVVKELLTGYNPTTKLYGDQGARIALIEEIYSKYLPSASPATVAAGVAKYLPDLRTGKKTPENIIIDLVSGIDYYTQSGGTNTNSAPFLAALYTDLFPGLTINPATDLPTSPTSVYNTQLTQALTPGGRLSLVTRFINGAAVKYDADGPGGSSVFKTTDYRTNFITALYQQYANRLPTTSELTSARAAFARKLVNGLQGSEGVYAQVLSSKAYFDTKIQNELAPYDSDNGARSNRSWIEGIFADRYQDRTPDINGFYSTVNERNTFSQKILDSFTAVRQTFTRSLTTTTDYKQLQVTKYYQLVHGTGRTPTDTELAAGVKLVTSSTYQALIAQRLASAEFASTVSPTAGQQTMYSITGDPVPSGTAAQNRDADALTWARAVYKVLFGGSLLPSNYSTVIALANLSKSAGRNAAALAVLNAVDGTSVATSSPYKPTIGLGGTYREKLINDLYQDILGRAPTRNATNDANLPIDPNYELGKALKFLKTNRWEIFQADLLLSREFYEIVG